MLRCAGHGCGLRGARNADVPSDEPLAAYGSRQGEGATCLVARREQAKGCVRRKQAKRATCLAARREQAHQAHQA